MGFNTTVVVLNDALEDIAKDKDFSTKLSRATLQVWDRKRYPNGVDVSAGRFLNAASVIETHNATHAVPILVGGNCGRPVDNVYIWSEHDLTKMEMSLLQELAKKHGYRLSRKPKK